MFDRYLVQPTGQSVYKTVTERRAPTDESVKLLREMEAAAKSEVEKTVRLDFNGFKVVGQFMTEPWNDQDRAVIKFDFNGRSVKADVVLERYETVDQRVEKIGNRIKDVLAAEIFRDATSQISGLFPSFRER